jgi:hypothetical protein
MSTHLAHCAPLAAPGLQRRAPSFAPARAPPARRRGRAAPPRAGAEPSSSASSASPSSADAPVGNPLPLPVDSREAVDQAFESIRRAYAAGARRQRVDLVLPLIGATDLDDWPGGIRQMFKAASPMCEQLLRKLRTLKGLEGPLEARVLDAADAVGSWEGAALALVVFPTAETLGEVRRVAEERPGGLILMVNPQYNAPDDFGFLPWVRAAATELVGSFENGYSLQEGRISGDSVRWLYTWREGEGGVWQVSVATGPATARCVLQRAGGQAARPGYAEVAELLRTLPWTMSSKSVFERGQAELRFIQESAKQVPRSK